MRLLSNGKNGYSYIKEFEKNENDMHNIQLLPITIFFVFMLTLSDSF